MNAIKHAIMKMKFTSKIIAAIFIGGFAFSIASCGKKDKTPKKPEDEVLIKVYCSGEEYWTNKKYFRANSIGESLDQITSKKKAMANAKADLASSINTTIKGTIDNYVKSSEFNNTEEVLENFESLTREVINQELTGIKTICEKQTKTKEGKYKTYIALELSADKLVTKMNERLSKDERLRIDYNYEKFKDTFDKEMEKLENR